MNKNEITTIARSSLNDKFIFQEMSFEIKPDQIDITVFSFINCREPDNDCIDFMCTNKLYKIHIHTKCAQIYLGEFKIAEVQNIEKNIYKYSFHSLSYIKAIENLNPYFPSRKTRQELTIKSTGI